jgi:uncharacterized protein involved in exopolysaccharide biosynthesis
MTVRVIDPAQYRRRKAKPKQQAAAAVAAAVPVMLPVACAFGWFAVPVLMPMLLSTEIRA